MSAVRRWNAMQRGSQRTGPPWEHCRSQERSPLLEHSNDPTVESRRRKRRDVESPLLGEGTEPASATQQPRIREASAKLEQLLRGGSRDRQVRGQSGIVVRHIRRLQGVDGLVTVRRKVGGGIAYDLQNYLPVPALAWRLVCGEGVSTPQNRLENQHMHDDSAGSAGVATEVICGVDPSLIVNWLGEPAGPRGVRMTAVQYVSDAVEIHYRLEWDRTDIYLDSEVPVIRGDVRAGADLLVTVGIPRRLRNFYCVHTEDRPPDFALDVVGSVQDPWLDWAAKAERYAVAGIRECWRFDMTGECLNPRLQGFRLERGNTWHCPRLGKAAS